MRRLLGVAVILALTAAFMVWVWPTPYRALAAVHLPDDVFAARQHRLTGEVELLTPIGWHRLKRPAAVIRHPSSGIDSARGPDPLAAYRPDWRGAMPTFDSAALRLNIAR
jgi:hypothetical protein